MAASSSLMSKLDSETRVVQQRLLAYVQERLLTRTQACVQEQLSTQTQALTAELVGREAVWGRERDSLYGRIAELEAENARLRGPGGSEQGKCGPCVEHKALIVGLTKDCRQCQEDSKERPDRTEEQVFLRRAKKRAKLRGYVQLLYAKDNEIARLEMKCQRRESEVLDLEDKYLSTIEDSEIGLADLVDQASMGLKV